MKKQPEITKKTRQRFVDVFWSLVKEKPISKISVSELTKRAGYNRSTFYTYFLDIDDLLTYVETELLNQLKQSIQLAHIENETLVNVFQNIFMTMNDKIYLLMGPNGDCTFLEKVQSEMIPLIEDYFPISKDLPTFDYLVCFANSALFGLLKHWNENGKDINEEEMSTMMQELVLHGLLGYNTLQSADYKIKGRENNE